MFLNHSKAFGDVFEASVAGVVPSGLLPETRVETIHGWLAAAQLEVGMSLYTYDGGLKPIVALRNLVAPGDAVRLPAGRFGCDDDTLPRARPDGDARDRCRDGLAECAGGLGAGRGPDRP